MGLLKTICVISLAVMAACRLGAMVPPPDALTSENAKCLIAKNHDFVIVRAYTSAGKVDRNFLSNLKIAKAAGFKTIDISVSPCLPCDPAEQVHEILTAVAGLDFAKIWVVIDVPGWREFKEFNRMFLDDMVSGLAKAGKSVGVFASKYEWEEAFGDDYDGASKYPLMYKNLNKVASFSDFRSFGGWKKAEVKQYQSGASLCSLKLDLAYRE